MILEKMKKKMMKKINQMKIMNNIQKMMKKIKEKKEILK